MRLLIVTRETDNDRRYGIGQSISRVADALRHLGHEVRYVSQADCQSLHQKWQPRFQRWLTRLGADEAASALAERGVQGMWAASEALRWGATHVWAHDPWLVLGLKAGLLRRQHFHAPFKVVVSEHGLGAFTRAVTLDGLVLSQRLFSRLLRLEKRVLLKADGVLCPSKAVLDALLRDLQLANAPAHFHVLGYGRPEHQQLTRLSARQALDLPDGVPIILAIGRLAPVKQHATVIRAVALLQSHYGLHVQLVIAGEGDHRSLEILANTLGLTHAPRLGAISPITDALRAADIYVSACSVEAFGLANREALAAGLPCIVAAGGANNDVLGHGAWLVEGQPNAMAHSLAALLQTPELRTHWQQQALHVADQWPSWHALSHDYEQFFLELSYG